LGVAKKDPRTGDAQGFQFNRAVGAPLGMQIAQFRGDAGGKPQRQSQGQRLFAQPGCQAFVGRKVELLHRVSFRLGNLPHSIKDLSDGQSLGQLVAARQRDVA